jgi:molybdate transport system ATP-binding protein
MSIEVAARTRLGAFTLDAAFLSEGGLTALFGPSGSGKTSLINVIAGLLKPAWGRVVVEGRVLLDTEARIDVASHKRRIGYVFQESRLFPHLSVRQNMLYGRWFAPRFDRTGSFDEVVDLLGLEPLLARGTAKLSGGEQQRVAIGRALLASPRLLLMDEPLASLDAARKDEVLPYLERLRDRAGVPILYVSHALAEVARLATRIVVMEEGRVVAEGRAAKILGRVDLMPLARGPEAGAIIDGVVEVHDEVFGLTTLASRAGRLRVPRIGLAPGATVRVRIQARDVMLALAQPKALSALNVLAGKVIEIGAGDGPMVEIAIDCGGARLVARLTRYSAAKLKLQPGAQVFAVIKSVTLDARAIGTAPEQATRSAGPASDF